VSPSDTIWTLKWTTVIIMNYMISMAEKKE
jgi:hypothetical protein